MTLDIAIQMDPPERLNPATDSTLILGLEAQRRGHRLYYYTAPELYLMQGRVYAPLTGMTFSPPGGADGWYRFGEPEIRDLGEMDVVLMRQDPPFNMAYLTATWLLERIHPETLVVNDPLHVRNAPEKLFPLIFAAYMPETLIASHVGPVRDFLAETGDVVIKPLYGHGGYGVFRLRPGDENVPPLLEHLFSEGDVPYVVQLYLPEVRERDCRVILVDGKMEAAFGRIPAEGDTRANTRAGGRAVRAELNARQMEICEAVGTACRERGILFAGLDLIGDYLTEINITSPTGMRFAMDLYGAKPDVAFWDAVEKRR